MNTSDTILSVQNLCMQFGGLQALSNVSLTAAKGKITSVIGPNGAGKTTLFNCITGFYQATAGNMLLRQDAHSIDLCALRGSVFTAMDFADVKSISTALRNRLFGGTHQIANAGIARTFQNIRLFRDMTAIENLLVAQHQHVIMNPLLGLMRSKRFLQHEKAALEQAYQWLAHFGLAADANRLAKELPYGKQRKLEIARALCTKPKLLCLDEPAAGLNPSESAELTNIITELKNQTGLAILLIEHDMRLVMNLSDYIYVLDHGEVIAHGIPATIQDHPDVIAAYLGIDAASDNR